MAFGTINIRDTNIITRCILIFFLACIIPGIGTPIIIYFGTKNYYDFWKPLYSLSIVSYLICTWFCIHCILGCFLILIKTTSKIIATLFSVSLLAVVIGTVYCIVYSQLTEIVLINPESYFIYGLKNYFSVNENIPEWLQEIQSQKKCCGISGPKDWLELIYPTDKPGIEDVPISCCLVKAIGCNFILKDLSNQAELAKWIYTSGCEISIHTMIQGLMNYIIYWSIPISILSVLLLSMFWYEVTIFNKDLFILSEQSTVENSMMDEDDIIKRNYSYDSTQDRINFIVGRPDSTIMAESSQKPTQAGKNVSFFSRNNNTYPGTSSVPPKSILVASKSSTSTTFEPIIRRGALFKDPDQ